MHHVIVCCTGDSRAQYFFTHTERNICSFPSVAFCSIFRACFIKPEFNPERIKSPGKTPILSAALYRRPKDFDKLLPVRIRVIAPSASHKSFPDQLRHFLRICENIVERQSTSCCRVDRQAVDLVIIGLNSPVIAVCSPEKAEDPGVRSCDLDSGPGTQIQKRRDFIFCPIRVIPCLSVRDLQNRILLCKFVIVFHGSPYLGKLFFQIFSHLSDSIFRGHSAFSRIYLIGYLFQAFKTYGNRNSF